MPYTRKTTYRKKRTFRKRGLNRSQYAATKRIVKKQLDKEVENKQRFINDPSTSITTTMSPSNLTVGIPQGIYANYRIGDSIRMKRITGKITFFNSATVPIWVRCVLLRTIASNYTPTAAELFFYPGYEITSPINWVKQPGKYRVVWDKTISVGETNSYEQQRLVRFSHVCKGLTKWDRDASPGPYGTTGHYIMCFVADAASGLTANISYYMSYEDA